MLAGCITFFLLLANVLSCRAEGETGVYREENPETGYLLIIEDKADLITDAQEAELAASMKEITAYGNVAFVTADSNRVSAEQYAADCYRERFGTQSGTLFLIDMENRMLWIHSDGAVYKVITKAYADTITDNVYRDASVGDYYECAAEVYRQISTLLEGERIAQPMKYISNGLLAVILALLLNFGLVCYITKLNRHTGRDILRNARKRFSCTGLVAEFSYETKVYDPVSSGSGGSSSSSSSGSRSSGGGGSRSSGGGGGHRF